jgi:hypothetical protein
MPDGLKSLFVAFILVGLFIFAIVGFAVQFQVDMNANDTILNETASNLNETYGWMAENLSETEATAKSQRESFESEKAKSEFGELTFSSIVGVGKTFIGTMADFFNIIFDLISVTMGFGEDNDKGFAVVIASLSAIFLAVVVFFAWRAYKAGS